MANEWRVDWGLTEEVGRWLESSCRVQLEIVVTRTAVLALEVGRHGPIEIELIRLGDGWTWEAREGTDTRMSLRFLTQTSGLYFHSTKQMGPSDSPILSSLSLIL